MLSVKNSFFRPAGPPKKHSVWAVLKASVYSDNTGVGGFCGSAWVFDVTDDQVIFVTAAHLAGPHLFQPNDAKVKELHVFLAQPGGLVLEISVNQVQSGENDIAFIFVPRKNALLDVMPLAHGTEVAATYVGKDVQNLGFPSRAGSTTHFAVTLNPPAMRFSEGPWEQNGKVEKHAIASVNAEDVKLSGASAYVLNHASEEGFSGGPLLQNGRVIGMMTMVVPAGEGESPTKSLAVHIGEIGRALEKLRFESGP